MRRAMLLATCARALRHARPARPSLTATYRQRVGASDEARLALKEYSEFGQEPIPETTSEEDVTLTGDAAVVRKAVGILAPYVSEERKDTFQRVVQQRTRHLSVAFERPSNPSNVWACLRTIDAFGCQDVHIVEDSLEEAAKRAAAKPILAKIIQRATDPTSQRLEIRDR